MKAMPAPVAVATVPTRLGAFSALFSPRGLARLRFPSATKRPKRAKSQQLSLARRLAAQLNDYFDGKRARFDLPLDLQGSTAFQRSVWREMQKIPPGTTRSYSEVAARIGQPAAARAVGRACGANPLPILIPCHRVVASHGALGGFSGGLRWKKKLLALEKKLTR
jgi:O-6-methylguanine DNA methyltransferase